MVLLILSLGGCRCRGERVGDKRAVACGEVAGSDKHDEVDLGSNKKLVRDGVRASIRGVAEDVPVAVTSFEGGAADADPGGAVSAIFVVGFGAMPRVALAGALTALGKRAPVIAVMGPSDEVDTARAAISDAHAIDGSVVRSFALAGLELVTLPGSDDPASIRENGCLARADDVRALSTKLGQKTKPRVILAYASPSRDPERRVASDAFTDASAWLIGGPLDRDSASEMLIPPGPAPAIAIPRALAARTTSTPSLIAPGYALLRAEGPNVQFKRAP